MGDGPRKVAAIIIALDDFGVRALLLRRRGKLLALFDLPGGDLNDGELPAAGLRRWLLHSDPIDPELVGALRWQWMTRYPLIGRTPGAEGVGFVMTMRVRGPEAMRLVSRDAAHSHALLWRDLSQVRQWAPLCPAGALLLLVAATSGPPTKGQDAEPIDEHFLWPPRRDGQDDEVSAARENDHATATA